MTIGAGTVQTAGWWVKMKAGNDLARWQGKDGNGLDHVALDSHLAVRATFAICAKLTCR
jgi:hypothetical protein